METQKPETEIVRGGMEIRMGTGHTQAGVGERLSLDITLYFLFI